jgi:hypothetical protein
VAEAIKRTMNSIVVVLIFDKEVFVFFSPFYYREAREKPRKPKIFSSVAI